MLLDELMISTVSWAGTSSPTSTCEIGERDGSVKEEKYQSGDPFDVPGEGQVLGEESRHQGVSS